jgi:fructose-1-phosphate kinase PfkB-like protein
VYAVEPVDATGCGDAFVAGFLAGMFISFSLFILSFLAVVIFCPLFVL